MWKWICFISFLQITSAVAQNLKVIKGKIADFETKETLPSSTAILLSVPDSSTVGYGVADLNGLFKITVKQSGNYLLKISSLGYETQILPISDEMYQEDLSFFLNKKDFQLNEVIIQESSPAIIRNDTTSYKVDNYLKDGENTLGELLRKMPNLRVEEGGDVFYKNKRIDKILLDGDGLIGENYSSSVNSLDPSVLNEVQVIENYQDNRLLGSVQRGTKTVLNLGVKEDKKDIFFGNIGLGVGSEAHNGIANLFSYRKKFKAYSHIAANNVGVRRMNGIVDFAPKELDNFEKSWEITTLLGIDRYIPYFLKTTYENPNKERLGNLNLSYQPSKKLNIVSNFNYYSDENRFQRENLTDYLLDSSFSTSQRDTLYRKPRIIDFRFKADYDWNELTTLKWDNWMFWSENNFGQNLFFDGGEFSEQRLQKMLQSKQVWNSIIELTRKLKDNQVLVISGYTRREAFGEKLHSIYIPAENRNSDDNSVPDSLDQDISNLLWQSAVQVKWLFSGKNIIMENQLAYLHQQYNFEVRESQQSEIYQIAQYARTPSAFQSINWEKNKWKLQFIQRLEYQRLRLGNKNRDRWNWQPSFNSGLKLNDNNAFNARVGMSIKPVYGLNNVAIPLFMDFRTMRQGIDSLLWNQEVNLFLNHNYSDIFERKISVNTSLFWVKNPTLWTLNQIDLRPEMVFMKFGRTTLNQSQGMMVKGEKLLYAIRGNIKIDFNLWSSRFEENVNGQDRLSKSITPSIGYGYISAFKSPVNIELKGYLQRNRIRIQQGENLTTNNFYNSNFNLTIKSKIEKFRSGLIVENFGIDGQQFQFLHFRVDYGHSERFSLYLDGRNLLNTDTFNMAKFTPNQFLRESYSLLGRIVTIGFNYAF